ncbi:MAG: hypothetical protein H6813_02355 [Phycisphaeraceae bacterium]|nr:hypothetical protein [Phycisphaeraceae bacterium]MCB9848840.1 hypothetical protein [Phycisphaeraceae bacterium]
MNKITFFSSVCAVTLGIGSGAFASGYAEMVAGLNPVGYWRLGESGGQTAVDETGVSNGKYKNEPKLGRDGVIEGDHAALFDGSDDWVQINHNPAYLLDEGAISFWLRVVYAEPDEDTQDTSRKGLFTKDSKDYDTGGHVSLFIINNHVEARLQSTTSETTLVTPDFTITEWTHVLLLFGNDGMELYLNGELADWDSYSGGLGTTSGGSGNFEPIVLGANSWASGDLSPTPLSGYFEGQIDEVVLLGFRPTPEQIAGLASTDGGAQPMRVVDWRAVSPVESE